jgi:Fe-S oxidoreductase
VHDVGHDPQLCANCETLDCLVRCQYLDCHLEEAKREWSNVLRGEESRVLSECATCYACEEYCPVGNHPFYLIVERQEEMETWPVPIPVTRQQIGMMAPRGRIAPRKVHAPVIDMCAFSALSGCIQGKLFEGASTIGGLDIFCNIMWLHFSKNSVIRERLPLMIENIQKNYLEPSGVSELVCYHDECYGAFTRLAPAFGIEVPFKPVHLFECLAGKLAELGSEIRPIQKKVAYQRPCSNRLVPETQHWVDDIFHMIGAERVERKYDRENALCCAMILRAMQREELADDIQKKNLDDMEAAGAKYCVFNCPACMTSLGELVAERGMKPILMSELCRVALGEKTGR